MKLLVAHELPLVRDGLKAILEGAGLAVVAVAASGREALCAALHAHPSATILNGTLAETDSITTVRQLRAELPATRIIGLCKGGDVRLKTGILAAGADTCLATETTTAELLAVLLRLGPNNGSRQAHARHAHAGAVDGAATAADSRSEGRARTLSPREREVLKLLAEGHSSKEIARRLVIGVPTVETHRRQVTEKLGMNGVARLTKWAIRHGITTLD
ncbi:MAG TPA: response regulator transcription factor [Polyangiaceae bacterium]|nr:response regulator transcription factor [Polyangiaceae bacterium]